jgi:NitT/TauT family transport system substrate-binding protein
MKHIFKKALLLVLTLALLLPLAVSCNKTPDAPLNDTPNDNNTPTNPTPDQNLEMKIYALNGTTALGLAQMIQNAKDGTDSMNYNISLHAAADAVTGPILSGECAIAALPTNVAVKLYHKSQGKIQLLALNTLGVLYLLQTPGENIASLEQLKGKTIYLPGAGSNPEYITAALLNKAGLKVGEDVTLDTTTYSSPDALQAAMIAGQAKLAVLPEPKVSVITTQKQDITVALDLTQEWEKINGANTLVQGCLVVNTAFAKAHPAEVKKFLEDYKASVEFIKAGTDDAINMIVNAGILPKAAIAKKALPKCNLCYFAGEDMKLVMNPFCEAIFAQSPASITQLPDASFYYVAK